MVYHTVLSESHPIQQQDTLLKHPKLQLIFALAQEMTAL